jgi:diguanylate cyclase (GGDEF)-like protein/PAS domain S-box-containing protein
MLSFLYAHPAYSEAAPHIDRKAVVVGGDHQYPPYEYLDKKGRPAGFHIDLLRLMGRTMGFTVMFKLGPWDREIAAFKQGKIDVLPMFRSRERERLVDFSEPHTILFHAIFSRSDGLVANSLRGLRGREIIVQRQALIHEYLLKHDVGARLVLVETEADAMRLLASGKHDFALATRIGGRHAKYKHRLSNLVTVGPPLLPSEYSLGVMKGNTELLDKLNQGMAILKHTGQYDELHDRWFGDLTSGGMDYLDALRYVAWVLLPLVTLAAAAFIWSWMLRNKVAQRTHQLHSELVERKRVSEALDRSQTTLATLLSNLPGMAYRCRNDKDWTMEFVSKGCLDLTGYPPESLVGNRDLSYAQLIHPDDQASVWIDVQDALRERRQFQLVYRLRVVAGEERWVWEQGQGIFSDSGDLLCLEGFITDITARKRAEQALVESEHKFAELVQEAPDVIVSLDLLGHIRTANPMAERISGLSTEQLIGKHFARLGWLAPHSLPKTLQEFALVLAGSERPAFELEIIRHDKSQVIMEALTRLVRHEGRPSGIQVTLRDVTDRKRAEQLSLRLGRILDNSPNEIYVFEATNLKFMQVNQSARRNIGYSLNELNHLTPMDLCPDVDREYFGALIEPLAEGREEVAAFNTVHRRKDGSHYPVEVRIHYSHAETPPVYVAVIQDITERKQAQERLTYLANYDTLTGLPNRILLTEQLAQAIKEANDRGRLVGLMFVGLDRFKNINDTLGHVAGDALLKEAGVRLADSVRPRDTVARLGGDQFAVVMTNVAHADDPSLVAQKILQRLNEPIHIAGRNLFVTASCGITLYPLDGEGVEHLLRNADAAMYQAKAHGRNNFQFYTTKLNERAETWLKLETDMHRALNHSEFVLHYQSQVDITTGRIAGVEALLRWQHPELGLVPPMEFIPIAEETGLIAPIGKWVLREACRQFQSWCESGVAPQYVAVNLSGIQFNDPGLLSTINMILQDTGLDPKCLELEITESVIMQNAEETVDILKNLKSKGVRLAIDDFGTGYSSLSYLKRFPIDTLKIDKAFIHDITRNKDDAAIVSAIIAMAKTLEIKIIAEGIETEEQLVFLRDHVCERVQGFLFSKPLPMKPMTELLSKNEFLVTDCPRNASEG